MYEIYLASEKDLALYKQFQIASWGEEGCPDDSILLARLKRLKDCILVLKKHGEPIGIATTMLLDKYDTNYPKSWNEITSNGLCVNHSPKGRIVYGVDLSLMNTNQGVSLDASSAILNAIIQLCVAKKTKFVYFGGRLVSYSKYCQSYPDPNKYLFTKVGSRYIDPHVQMCSKVIGLKPIKVIPNYFEDPDSLNYGVLYQWENPFLNISNTLDAVDLSFETSVKPTVSSQ